MVRRLRPNTDLYRLSRGYKPVSQKIIANIDGAGPLAGNGRIGRVTERHVEPGGMRYESVVVADAEAGRERYRTTVRGVQ